MALAYYADAVFPGAKYNLVRFSVFEEEDAYKIARIDENIAKRMEKIGMKGKDVLGKKGNEEKWQKYIMPLDNKRYLFYEKAKKGEFSFYEMSGGLAPIFQKGDVISEEAANALKERGYLVEAGKGQNRRAMVA
ncbi:hypothetical protein COU37_01895 [Candidatus Micrarchaeota archaeon CG10_big_fil_rev_8_21_14_0_10_45_29]|nr:MAG: hypothetical protein COU37_01895 [Candidatus Micrarchaeota archaeon CG10_big_fil_rev_8_21_14_0_10_45_29]